MGENIVLAMRDISKTFPGVKALQHVDFTLRKGEIHALMGRMAQGNQPVPEPVSCGKPVYWPGAPENGDD